MTLPLAVCLLLDLPLEALEERFLAISRRNQHDQWGLPGGKVDPGETPVQACVRETFEEVGLKIDPDDLVEIYDAVCPGEVTYSVKTFLYCGYVVDLKDLKAEDGMVIDAKPAEVLTNSNSSPFADYNVGVMEAFRTYSDACRSEIIKSVLSLSRPKKM